MATITVYPSGYDYKTGVTSSIEKAYSSVDNTTYMTIQMQGEVYYTFDLSDIPSDVSIKSVSCRAKASGTTLYLQLYTGTTAKGTASRAPSSAGVIDLTPGDWTRDELDNIRLKVYINQNMTLGNFYGANLTIEYEEGSSFCGNQNFGGVWEEMDSVWECYNGVWTELVEGYENINGVWQETN